MGFWFRFAILAVFLARTAWAAPPFANGEPQPESPLPMISIEDGIRLELDDPSELNLSLAELQQKDQAKAEDWVQAHENFDLLVNPFQLRMDAALPNLSATAAVDRKVQALLTSKLVLQVMTFAREFSGGKEAGYARRDFRAQFTRALSLQAPGFAWVVTAQRLGFDAGSSYGTRTSVAAGVQVPLFGSDSLFVGSGEVQGLLRVMPLAAVQEKLYARESGGEKRTLSESGLRFRPSVELEASYRQGRARGGFRFLAQPRIDSPSDVRMLAEVFVEFKVVANRRALKAVNIVPRCMMDVSPRFHQLSQKGTGEMSGEMDIDSSIYGTVDRVSTCMVSAQLVWGK
jgi:hypothetical protein